jgi:hypothetical protein
MLTMFWDEYENDVLLVSCEKEVSGEPGSVNLIPNRLDPKLRSELVETREVRPESM